MLSDLSLLSTTTTTTTLPAAPIPETATAPSTATATKTILNAGAHGILSASDTRTNDPSDQVKPTKIYRTYEHKAIPLGTCLFCRMSFLDVEEGCPNIEESMTHMYDRHGFWIPYIEYLVNLEDFLAYLGEKIGLGRICLHCNGRKKACYLNLQAVQNHMNEKSHCKMRFDEEDMDEYDIFFKFPSQTEEQKKKGVADITAGGELILHDGSIIGHRDYWPIYKQNLLPEVDDRTEVILARIKAECRKLMLKERYPHSKKGHSEMSWPILKKKQKERMQLGIRNNKNARHHFREQNPK